MPNSPDLVVLVNLGTPEAATPSAVAAFLREFLSDPAVVDWPAWIWQPVLHRIILRTRPRRIARLYREIWSEEGSPLETGTKRITKALQARIGSQAEARWAYRYGKASLAQRLPNWVGESSGRIIVVPLFPQRTGSSLGTIVSEAKRLAEDTSWTHRLEVRELAPDDPGYIEALAQRTIAALTDGAARKSPVDGNARGIAPGDTPGSVPGPGNAPGTGPGNARAEVVEPRENAEAGAPGVQLRSPELRGDEVDHLLLSFHGIPVRYDRNELGIYQGNCRRTAAALLERLAWPREKATLCFQSRFGPERWLGPATAQLLRKLPRRGARRIAIATPGFLTDGLETLEEIGRLGRSQFLEAGGEHFVRIPVVGDQECLIGSLADLVTSVAP